MDIALTRIDPTGADRDELIHFLVGGPWPFHVVTAPTRERIVANIDDGVYDDEDHRSYWVDHRTHGRVGFLRLEDLTDDTPMFDLRLSPAWRGRGLGSEVLDAATALVFETLPDAHRFEGQTRDDNIAMRRVFERSGWVHEAHYRDGWPVEGSAPRASVAYAVLRRDWESGTVTPVPWPADPGGTVTPVPADPGGTVTPPPADPEVTLTGTLVCADDAEAARVREHLPEHLALTRSETGCRAFDVDATDDPLVFSVRERFVDEAAFDAHQRRTAASTWGRQTAGITRSYVVRGRAADDPPSANPVAPDEHR